MRIHDYGLRKKRWSHFLKQFGISFLRNAAGRFTIDFAVPLYFIKNDLSDYNTIDVFMLSIHFFPKAPHIEWGYSSEWYDGYLYSLGFGPLILFCWTRRAALEKE